MILIFQQMGKSHSKPAESIDRQECFIDLLCQEDFEKVYAYLLLVKYIELLWLRLFYFRLVNVLQVFSTMAFICF